MQELKWYASVAILILTLVFAWTYLYVIPTANKNNAVMSCQMGINDMSYEGYKYCLNNNKKELLKLTNN